MSKKLFIQEEIKILSKNKYVRNVSNEVILRKDSFIHSDQGAHYTSPIFQNKVKEVTDYIDYYNNYRAQWNLKKMTPVDYRNHLLNIS